MDKIAIDIVLLPPPKMAEAATLFSDELCAVYGEKMHLNATDCLPHISLLMGVIEEKDLEKASEILQEIVATHLPVQLEVTGVVSRTSSTSIEFERTTQFAELQDLLIEKLRPLLSYQPEAEMFYDQPEPMTLQWVANFMENSTGENFSPHLTVGPASEDEQYDGQLYGKASQIAICQLGNYCSCKKLLATI